MTPCRLVGLRVYVRAHVTRTRIKKIHWLATDLRTTHYEFSHDGHVDCLLKKEFISSNDMRKALVENLANCKQRCRSIYGSCVADCDQEPVQAVVAQVVSRYSGWII